MKKSAKRILAALLSICMVVSVWSPALIAEAATDLENIALNATASTTNGTSQWCDGITAVNDGDDATNYQSPGEWPTKVALDLNGNYDISSVVVKIGGATGEEEYRSVDVKVEYTQNGDTEQLITFGNDTSAVNSNKEFTVSEPVSATNVYVTLENPQDTTTTTPGFWAAFNEIEVYGVLVEDDEENLDTVLPTGTTQKQPFEEGTAGSNKFRIPALLTLNDGSILAAADARWTNKSDGYGIDTIISHSVDNGANWNYSFVNYFDDSVGSHGNAAAFIDPVLVQGKNDVIYLFTDILPGGKYIETISNGSGYVQVGEEYYLALYDNTATQDVTAPKYYVANELNSDGYYNVYNYVDATNEGTVTDYALNPEYDIYSKTGDGTYSAVTATQLGTDTKIKANIFYSSDTNPTVGLYVYQTEFVALRKGTIETDGTITWGNLKILNGQIKIENNDQKFYGVGPGVGLCTSDGTIICPMYTYNNEISSFIYSTDGGDTWSRTANATSIRSSESQLVELDDGTLRCFFRNSAKQVCYTDAEKNTDGGYTWSQNVVYTGVTSCSNTQMSAIKYSEKIDGKEAIIISYPASSSAEGNSAWDRTNGRISIGLVQTDGTMDWKYTYSVNDEDFWYSCLTELEDGSISILYEYNSEGTQLQYTNYAVSATAADDLQLTETADVKIWVSGKNSTELIENASVVVGTTTELQLNGVSDGAVVTVSSADESVATATYADGVITLTGVGTGTKKFIETTLTVRTNDGGVAVFDVNVADEAADNYKFVEILRGENVTFTDTTGNYTGADVSELDEDIAEATVSGTTTVLAGQLASGNSDSAYGGEKISLENCLYTFTAVDDGDENTYVFTMAGADGTAYFNPAQSSTNTRNPHTSTSADITITERTLDDGSVVYYLSAVSGTSNRYIYFKDSEVRFDAGNDIVPSTNSDSGYRFQLFKQASATDKTAAIPGYELVTSAAELQDGGKYLIAAQIDGSSQYYVAYPTTSTANGNYSQIAKVLTGDAVTEKYYTEIVFTGVAEGETVVTVGKTRYYITVVSVEDQTVTLKVGEKIELNGSGTEIDNDQIALCDHKVAVVTAESTTEGHAVTIRGIATGTTSVIIGTTRYNITVQPADKITLDLNASDTYVIGGGIVTAPADEEVATAVETNATTYKKIESLDELVDCGEYLFVPVLKTTHAVSKEESNMSPSGLALTVMGDDLSALYWRVLVNGDGTYSIQDPATGKYMVLNGNDTSLGSQQKLEIVVLENTYNGTTYNGFGVRTGSTYLNCYGGVGNNNAAAYNGYDVASTWYIYKRETTITAVAEGSTNAVINGITYQINVTGKAEKDVVMYVGDQNIYTGNMEANTDNTVVSTTESDNSYTKVSDVASVVSGGKYLILNGAENAIVNGSVDPISYSGSTGLGFIKNVTQDTLINTDYSAYLWTFTLVEGTTDQYYVQNAAGKYLSVNEKTSGGSVTLVEVAEGDTIPSITLSTHANGGFTLKSNITDADTYFNNHGGQANANCATSWTDAGGQGWSFYKPVPSTITVVTAENIGKSDVTIGNTIYHITVKEAAATYVDTVYLMVGDVAERTNQGIYDADSTLDESYDASVVTAVMNDNGTSHTVTFTALAEGRTVVDAGATRYYVYVTESAAESVVSEEDVVVYVGQTKYLTSTENGASPYTWAEGYDTYLENCTVYGVNKDLMAVRGNGTGNTVNYGGISAYYIGDAVDLSDCLYTFTATGEADANTYIVSANGVYLNYSSSNKAPNKTSASTIGLTDAGNMLFWIRDTSNNRDLFFTRDGSNAFDNGSSHDDRLGYKFALYRPATAEELTAGADTILPGYVQVSEVVDGGQYLIVASYDVTVDDGNVTYYYAIYPSTSTGTYDQSVQIVTSLETGNKYSSVTFTGKAKGKTTLAVDTKNYNITVLEQPEVMNVDSTPFISNTGNSDGHKVTKLNLSADKTFMLEIGNGYPADAVEWKIIDGTTGEIAEWATITNGTIEAVDKENHTTTYNGYVVAVIDGVEYKIPLTITPAPILTNGAAARLYDIHVEETENTNVYYTWLYEYAAVDENGDLIYDDAGELVLKYAYSELTLAVEGQVFYVSQSNARMNAIDFFAAPYEGYALTYMRADNSAGDYERIDGEVPNVDFLTAVGDNGKEVAGHQQLDYITANGGDEAAQNTIIAAVLDAQELECQGAQGFNRYASDGGLSTIMYFRSEKLPTVEKRVRGVLGASGMADTYRVYTEGMAVTEGEYIYYDIIVQTYDAEDQIYYVDDTVKLKDTMLTPATGTAYFYEKDEENDEDPINQKLTEIDITEDIQNDGLVGATHEYYVVYQVQKADVAAVVNNNSISGLTNHVDLTFDYTTDYVDGEYHADSAAEAKVLLTDETIDDIVIDFGLPVVHTYTNDQVYFTTTEEGEPLKTLYGEVTITHDEIKGDSNEVVGYTSEITYTPTKILQGMDTVTVTGSDGKAYVFNVYPASTAYYEEGFANYTDNWVAYQYGSETPTELSEASKGNGEQKLQTLTETVAENEEAESLEIDQYGYDVKYATESVGASNGTDVVSNAAGDLANFTFTGNGLDIYANCQGETTPTGTISVLVRNADTNAIEKLMIVNTKIAGTDGGATAAQNNIGAAYSLPVASIGLGHGDHNVTISHSKTKAELDANKIYPVKLDGFRVYNTLTDQTVYAEHNEINPGFLELRNSVLGAIDLTEVLKTTNSDEVKSVYAEDIAAGLTQVYNSAEVGGAAATAFIVKNDTTDNIYKDSAKDLLDNGPKNEIFLYPGESLIFAPYGGLENVQLGLKTVNGTVSGLTVTKQTVTTPVAAEDGTTAESVTNKVNITTIPGTIKSSTDMFYKIGDIEASTESATVTTTITVTNPSTSAILCITDMKYFGGTLVTADVLRGLTEEDFIPALTSMGYKSVSDDYELPSIPLDPENPEVSDNQEIIRISGATRYETSYAVAEEYKAALGADKFDAVIVATGTKFADALSGSYLSSVKNAPILLTNEKRVDELVAYVKANLTEDGTVYILGGAAAVPETVEAGLADYTVKRLAGTTRYETNLAILEEAGVTGREILIATGTSFADSLSASATKKPILLVKDEITDAHRAVLRQYDGGKIYIIGGTGAVSEEIQTALTGHGRIYRISGTTRYETSVEVAKTFFADATEAVLAYAKDFPDGLSGGPLAMAMDAPLILTAEGKTDAAAAYAQEMGIESGVVLGGDSRISDDSVRNIFGLSEDAEIIVK